MKEALQSSEQEILRLSQNSRVLFDLLPDMLLIIKDDFVIERMNQAAIDKLGDQHGRKCHEALAGRESPCETAVCPFDCKDEKPRYGEVLERKLRDDFYVEYSYVPFEGYRQDNLILLVVRDVTQKKLHELELQKYSQNIENVLKEKIEILKKNERERQQLYKEVNHLKKETERLIGHEKMLGESKPIKALREMVYQVAASTATVLITGESGTGKELVADLIHQHSSRADKQYLKFNCSAVAESLLESDLFGYEKGAYTGATATHKGKFEEADGGTLFLDEIGDISPKMQTSLLRALQEGEIFRVGSNTSISVDVRIIAATNSDLEKAVESGKFREDLYYRLNVINLHQVPLRERKDDIVLLATNFLLKFRERFKKEVTFLPNSVVERLLAYDWPGNVRELENTIQRAVLLSRNGVISPDNLGIHAKTEEDTDHSALDRSLEKFFDRPLKESVAVFEAEVIASALEKHKGRIDDVCECLGMPKTTLYEKMKRYDISPKEYKNK